MSAELPLSLQPHPPHPSEINVLHCARITAVKLRFEHCMPLWHPLGGHWYRIILKGITSEYSLEGLMLKLKLQYFGHLMQRRPIGKDPDAGKIEGRRRRGWQRMRWLDSSDSAAMNLCKLQEWRIEEPDVLQSMGSQSWTRLSD